MKNNPGKRLKYYLELARLKIMLPVSLTGFTGYFIFDPNFSVKILLISLGILLMAVAASALNQLQEAGTDRMMSRTKNRPVPSQKISFRQAVLFIAFTIAAGTTIIWIWGNSDSVLIVLFTILWYNGVYTYSKKITAFAVVPGALTGALPPLIGWVAAGGGIWDKPIIFIGFLLFTGQIPHFWLLILKYGEEYNKAGLPSLTDHFSHTQIKRLTFTWVVTSAVAAIFLCYFEILKTALIAGILILASVFLIWQFSELLRISGERYNNRKYTVILDLYFLLVLILLIADRIMSKSGL